MFCDYEYIHIIYRVAQHYEEKVDFSSHLLLTVLPPSPLRQKYRLLQNLLKRLSLLIRKRIGIDSIILTDGLKHVIHIRLRNQVHVTFNAANQTLNVDLRGCGVIVKMSFADAVNNSENGVRHLLRKEFFFLDMKRIYWLCYQMVAENIPRIYVKPEQII